MCIVCFCLGGKNVCGLCGTHTYTHTHTVLVEVKVNDKAVRVPDCSP